MMVWPLKLTNMDSPQAKAQQRILEGDHFLRPPSELGYKPTPTNREIWERLEALTKDVERLRQALLSDQMARSYR